MHKVFSCSNCDEIFDTKRDFKVHSYTHSFTNEMDTNKCKIVSLNQNPLIQLKYMLVNAEIRFLNVDCVEMNSL